MTTGRAAERRSRLTATSVPAAPPPMITIGSCPSDVTRWGGASRASPFPPSYRLRQAYPGRIDGSHAAPQSRTFRSAPVEEASSGRARLRRRVIRVPRAGNDRSAAAVEWPCAGSESCSWLSSPPVRRRPRVVWAGRRTRQRRPPRQHRARRARIRICGSHSTRSSRLPQRTASIGCAAIRRQGRCPITATRRLRSSVPRAAWRTSGGRMAPR